MSILVWHWPPEPQSRMFWLVVHWNTHVRGATSCGADLEATERRNAGDRWSFAPLIHVSTDTAIVRSVRSAVADHQSIHFGLLQNLLVLVEQCGKAEEIIHMNALSYIISVWGTKTAIQLISCWFIKTGSPDYNTIHCTIHHLATKYLLRTQSWLDIYSHSPGKGNISTPMPMKD